MPSKRKPAKKRPKPREGLERPYCNGLWTSPRYFQFIRTALRKASSRWGPAFTALKEAEVGKKINMLSGRIAMHYRCADCGGHYARKSVQIDHIVEVGSLRSHEELPGFVQRLFCEKDGFAILCLACHHTKTHAKETNDS